MRMPGCVPSAGFQRLAAAAARCAVRQRRWLASDGAAYGGGGGGAAKPPATGVARPAVTRSKMTLPQLAKMYRNGDKISMLTAYDCSQARIAE